MGALMRGSRAARRLAGCTTRARNTHAADGVDGESDVRLAACALVAEPDAPGAALIGSGARAGTQLRHAHCALSAAAMMTMTVQMITHRRLRRASWA